METGKRELTFLLAGPERRVLRAIAERLPRRVTSNHLTALGVLGAIVTGAAYALTGHTETWLWIASAGLLINWFGDSLDGTLARVRKAERPRYGYYLDHIVDAFSTAVIGVGIGLSPFLRLDLALVLVVAYLALSINIYLESTVFGRFRLAYGRIGPTEVRLILIITNAMLVFGPSLAAPFWRPAAFTANIAAAVLTVGMVLMLAVRFGGNLRALAKLEPSERKKVRAIGS